MSEVSIIEAEYRLVTPLFSKGAYDVPEVRPPSFRGILRFWWRALAWCKYGGRLDEIRERECSLFGEAGKGVSRVEVVEFSPSGGCDISEVGEILEDGSSVVGMGCRYLGYGLMEAFASRVRQVSAGQLTRACVKAPCDLKARITYRKEGGGGSGEDEERKLLLAAIKAIGLVGGLGARSRRGYGSLALKSLKVGGLGGTDENSQCDSWEEPRDINGLQSAIEALYEVTRENGGCADKSCAACLPGYTAFSAGSRHVLLTGANGNKLTPLGMLDLVGREMVRYRSWGRNGVILENINSEKNFKDDHDLMEKPPKNRAGHPRRIAFGLPHNYGRADDKRVMPVGHDRRASPLFIHIHETEKGPVAVLSFFPALFLSGDDQGNRRIDVGGKYVEMQQEKELFEPINEFLDRLLDSKKRKKNFTEALEVKVTKST